jgi:hypothetical protein
MMSARSGGHLAGFLTRHPQRRRSSERAANGTGTALACRKSTVPGAILDGWRTSERVMLEQLEGQQLPIEWAEQWRQLTPTAQ